MARIEKSKTELFSYHVVVKGLHELSRQLELLYDERLSGEIFQITVTPHPIPNSSTWNYSIVYTTTRKEKEIEFRDL